MFDQTALRKQTILGPKTHLAESRNCSFNSHGDWGRGLPVVPIENVGQRNDVGRVNEAADIGDG